MDYKYKLIVADDEDKVCKLICNVIDWDVLDVEIVDTANTGYEAYDKIRKYRPDIVLTDIKMPGLDGIELIEKVKNDGIETSFVIISGFRQFEYAKSAFKFDVCDYILKPIDEKELYNTIKRVIGKIEQQSKIIYVHDSLKHELKLARQEAFNRLITNPYEINENILNEFYKNNFDSGVYQVIAIKADIVLVNSYEKIYNIVNEKIKSIINAELENMKLEYIITEGFEGIYVLIYGSEGFSGEIRDTVNTIYKQSIKIRENYGKLNITIGVSEELNSIPEIKAAIIKVKNIILSRMFIGMGKVSYLEETVQDKYLGILIDNNLRNRLIEKVDIFDIQGIEKIISDIKEKFLLSEINSGQELLKLCEDILECYHYGLKIIKEEIDINDMKALFYQKFCTCINVDEVFSHLVEYVSKHLSEVENGKENAELRSIRIVKQYLLENYHLPIRLEDAAGLVGFNPTYFSSFFKKNTGENFSEYLISIRVSKAKQLLSEDSGKDLFYVSEKVGYKDIKYFSKIFKKSTGLTPMEYKKLYQRI